MLHIADVIDELVKTGKEIEAVYFVHESGLTERFPPDSLLKFYLQASRKKANSISKNGNNSIAAKVYYLKKLFCSMNCSFRFLFSLMVQG